MTWSNDIVPADDKFHARDDDPYWNESHLTTFYVPEAKLMGVVYYYFRPNMKLCIGGPMIWDDTGADAYNCLYYAWDQCMAMPENAEMNDFEFPNGLSVSTVELQQRYQMRYSAPDCQLDLTFNALLPPHAMIMEKDTVNPSLRDFMTYVPGADAKLTTGHYEQMGRVSGTVTVRGTTYTVNSTSRRDHTWGPRKQLTNMPRLRGGWPCAIVSKDHAFWGFGMCQTPHEEDPVLGTTETVTSGVYTKDGMDGWLSSGTRRVLERNADGLPLREVFEATDGLGRQLHAECTYLNWLKFVSYSDCLGIWGLCEWQFDGHTVYGENMDYMYHNQFRKLWEAIRSGGDRQLQPVLS